MSTLTSLTAEMLEGCQKTLDYRFQNVQLLRNALTHASGANSRLASNERLEFLGDAVLGLIVCEQLYEKYATLLEGEMTRIKSIVVSRRTCARISRTLGLDKFLMIGKGMQTQVPSNVLADVIESLLAAIYLDGGLEEARRFILRFLGPEITHAADIAHGEDHKSALQQRTQRETGIAPSYELLDEKGPEHSKCFQVAAVIGDVQYAPAWGQTKKEAEQKAALNALAQLQGQCAPFPAD